MEQSRSHDRSPIRLTQTETVIRRSSLIGFLNSQRKEATIKLARNPSLTCPRLLASSTRAVSIYWKYVALLTWPITSMSRNWTGRSMLNFNGNPSLGRENYQNSAVLSSLVVVLGFKHRRHQTSLRYARNSFLTPPVSSFGRYPCLTPP